VLMVPITERSLTVFLEQIRIRVKIFKNKPELFRFLRSRVVGPTTIMTMNCVICNIDYPEDGVSDTSLGHVDSMQHDRVEDWYACFIQPRGLVTERSRRSKITAQNELATVVNAECVREYDSDAKITLVEKRSSSNLTSYQRDSSIILKRKEGQMSDRREVYYVPIQIRYECGDGIFDDASTLAPRIAW